MCSLTLLQRSIAEVQWKGISRKNIYRAGHTGKVRKQSS